MTFQRARKQAVMGIYCVRDLNPETGEISLNLDLNSKTGEKSPDRGVYAVMIAGAPLSASTRARRLWSQRAA
jgi:hypothetical protein